MGNITSCCTLEDGKKTKNEDELVENFSPAEINAFKERLSNNVDIIVLLQDGAKLACQLQVSFDEKTLCISCQQKVRQIKFSDIRTILYGEEQLKRVETQANLVKDNCCLALHLDESGNCIPIKFESVKEKNLFIFLMKFYRKQP